MNLRCVAYYIYATYIIASRRRDVLRVKVVNKLVSESTCEGKGYLKRCHESQITNLNSGLKRRLGITAWREFSDDMTQVRYCQLGQLNNDGSTFPI